MKKGDSGANDAPADPSLVNPQPCSISLRISVINRENCPFGRGTLSGGEQQMLAISRALMAKPRLLLMDEPSLGLAPLIVKQIFEIIKKINTESKTTIFLVEQNANMALKVAHRGYVMDTGRVTLSDTAQNLMANDAVQKAYL